MLIIAVRSQSKYIIKNMFNKFNNKNPEIHISEIKNHVADIVEYQFMLLEKLLESKNCMKMKCLLDLEELVKEPTKKLIDNFQISTIQNIIHNFTHIKSCFL